MSRQLAFSVTTSPVSICRQVLQRRLKISYGLSHFIESGLTLATYCELTLLTQEGLSSFTVICDMGRDRSQSLPVDFSYGFFPVSASVGRPLKGQLHHLPWLAELRGAMKGGAQDLALQVRVIGPSRRASDGKIEENGAGGLECHAHFPKAAHAQGG